MVGSNPPYLIKLTDLFYERKPHPASVHEVSILEETRCARIFR